MYMLLCVTLGDSNFWHCVARYALSLPTSHLFPDVNIVSAALVNTWVFIDILLVSLRKQLFLPDLWNQLLLTFQLPLLTSSSSYSPELQFQIPQGSIILTNPDKAEWAITQGQVGRSLLKTFRLSHIVCLISSADQEMTVFQKTAKMTAGGPIEEAYLHSDSPQFNLHQGLFLGWFWGTYTI